MRYEVVVIWDDGSKEVYGYGTFERAKRTAEEMKKVFGNQIWTCVRERRA